MQITKLLKVAITALMLSLLPSFVSAANDPVESFEKLILDAQNATNTSTPVYFNDYAQAWAKKRFSVAEITYDVKATDSLISPIVGVISFQLVTEQTDLYSTKSEAESTTAFDPKFESPYFLTLTYAYRNDAWTYSNGEYENLLGFLKGQKFDVSAQSLRDAPKDAISSTIILWLPK